MSIFSKVSVTALGRWKHNTISRSIDLQVAARQVSFQSSFQTLGRTGLLCIGSVDENAALVLSKSLVDLPAIVLLKW